MKLIRKYIQRTILTTIIFSTLIVGVRVYGSVVNESTGAEKTYSSGGTCPHCSWHFGGDYASGIRLGLYKYDGTGNPIKCGESIDLLNTASSISKGSLITSGYSRFDYTHGTKSVGFYQGYVKVDDAKSNIRAESVAKYNGGRTYSLTVSSSSEEPWGTKFVKNFSNYLGDSYAEVNARIKEIFKYYNFTEEEAGKYYITIEPTMTVYSRNHNDQKVYGTGYEIISEIDTWQSDGYTYDIVQWTIKGEDKCECKTCKPNSDNTVCTANGLDFITSQGNTMRRHVFNAMYVAQNDAKLFAQDGRYDGNNFINEKGTGLITPETKTVPEGQAWSESYAKKNYLKDKSGYGITVLWMQDVVKDDDCVGSYCRTCKNYCAGLDGDALENCAVDYCKSNNPNDPDCILSCKDTVYESPGCDRATLNVCYNSDLQTSDIKSVGNYCASTGETAKQELTSTICYDDVDGNTYTLESKLVSFNDETLTTSVYEYAPVTLSYYKIECDEKVTFENLPSRADVHVSNSLTASLYAGYTMGYSKVCQIYYKAADETWVTDYSKSKIQSELTKYNEILKKINEAIPKLRKEKLALDGKIDKNMTKDEKDRLEEINKSLKSFETSKPAVEAIISELSGIKSEAERRLIDVKDRDQATNNALVNEVEIEISNTEASSSSTKTITLEPVYCIGNNAIRNEEYCDLETQKGFKVTESTNNVTCQDSNGRDIKATVSGGTSTYTEKVYYSIPSSYTGTNDLGATIVCHTKACTENLKSAFEIKNAWVFDPLSGNVTIDAYNAATSHNDLNLRIKGMGSCGQFTFELNCGYDFESSAVCKEECIEKYNDPSSGMTEAEYDACFKEHCSCDSYCGSNVACRMKYCPQECEGCEDHETTETSCVKDTCIDDCNKTYGDADDRMTCRFGCCRTGCNGEEGCIYNCCMDECDAKRVNNYITEEEYEVCKKSCTCENGACPPSNCVGEGCTPGDGDGGRNYIYRTINLNRPFPDGDNPDGRTPGANWYGKVKYITETDDVATKYYDATDGVTEEYEYRFVLTSDNIKEIKANDELDLTYTEFKESKEARNKYEDATRNKPEQFKADVYCSYIIHDYFKSIGIEATSNAKNVKNKYVVGSGCYTQ